MRNPPPDNMKRVHDLKVGETFIFYARERVVMTIDNRFIKCGNTSEKFMAPRLKISRQSNQWVEVTGIAAEKIILNSRKYFSYEKSLV